MGATYTFSCEKCKLEATVSGGPDCGMCAEWRTVWCSDCRQLSDATTLSENKDCLSKAFLDCPELPKDLCCPSCSSGPIEPAEGNTCPKCHGPMVEHLVGPRFQDQERACQTCGFHVNAFKSAPQLWATEADIVTVRMYCAGCERYVNATFHRSGAYAPMSEWVEHQLQCHHCRSLNVRAWNHGEPCPLCGGRLESSGEVAEFCD